MLDFLTANLILTLISVYHIGSMYDAYIIVYYNYCLHVFSIYFNHSFAGKYEDIIIMLDHLLMIWTVDPPNVPSSSGLWNTPKSAFQLIGLREKLQENPIFYGKIYGFL